MDETANSSGAPKADGKYFAAVGALLVMICATLAVLWILERRGRVRAESDAARLRQDLEATAGALAQGAMMRQMQRAAGAPGPQPVPREDLAAQFVEHEGARRQVLLLPAAAGRRLGFEVGDLILISPAPTTAPSTAPSSGSPPGPAAPSNPS